MEKQPPTTNNFNPEQLKRLQPISFLNSCLNNTIRPDGRKLRQSRSIQSHSGGISTAHASTIISIGNTSVVCAIKFEIAQPELSKPNQAYLVPNIDLGPMCCPKYRSGPPNDESQILSSRLRDILISSHFVSLDSLVIEPAKFVWVVYLDIVCLSNDGNLFDAIFTSAITALQTARIPVVKFDADSQRVVLANQTSPETVPLTLAPTLTAHTFAIFGSSTILPDPSLFEEELASGTLSFVLDNNHQIHHLLFFSPPDSSAPPLLPNLLKSCLQIINQNPRSILP